MTAALRDLLVLLKIVNTLELIYLNLYHYFSLFFAPINNRVNISLPYYALMFNTRLYPQVRTFAFLASRASRVSESF